MQGPFILAIALAAASPAAAAQQSAGGTARAAAEISSLTLEIARTRMLVENLISRLAPDSPEPPKSEKERVELQASLEAQHSRMGKLIRELSVRCGEQEPVRGHIGVVTEQMVSTETGPGGRGTTTLGYHVVTSVTDGSPAARAGLAPGDTIIAVNRSDARVRSLDPYVREPGRRLTLTLGREGGRREVNVVVGQRPPTFDGGCLQYRDVRFTDPNGQTVVMYRTPGSTGPAGAGGTARAGAGPGGQGGAIRPRVNTTAQGQSTVRVIVSPDSTAQSTFIMIPPVGAGSALFLARGGSGAIVAGAEVSLVNGGLKTIFAVDHGALVLNVAPRSPAEQAGILSGDVIVRANGENITAISVLQREIHAAREKRSVSLDIIRTKQPKQITLRW